MKERVVVTGAAGFVGSHLAGALLRHGASVVGVDNFDPYYPRAQKERALLPLRGRRGFAFVEGDVRDQALVARLLDGASAVVHLAARPGVRASLAAPEVTRAINVDGTAAVLRAARAGACRRVVFASSSSVYGHGDGQAEDGASLAPLSPYAESKRLAEELCLRHAPEADARVAVLRLFSVYGPGQRPDQAVARFTELMAVGESIERFGDGTSERDYTYVTDVVAGILAALRWTDDPEAAGEVFNVGLGRPVPLDTVIRILAALLGASPRVRERAVPAADARRTRADLSKARAVLDYRPQVDIEEGLARYVSWYEDTHARERRATA